ncbi:glycosyltransferase family 9 protein [Synechococcus sp. MIT S1220]|uniref:glycosyltransferase family 9 protein n=1 Tax=Synechococcus sp. MIT S1220 TaxID=3082549 RepID=UPI0039B0FDC4
MLRSTDLIDLRGKTTLIELAGACRQARAVISVDAGPLHIAAAVGTPTLAVVGNDVDGVGASPIRLWQPRCSNVERTVSNHHCSVCAEHRFGNDDCLVEGHPCMQGVSAQSVIDWLSTILSKSH